MFAIVEAGGRQEKVEAGTTVVVDRLEAEPGATVTFDRVLLVGDEHAVRTGVPYVAGASVTGVVVFPCAVESVLIDRVDTSREPAAVIETGITFRRASPGTTL